MPDEVKTHRFPPPWKVDEHTTGDVPAPNEKCNCRWLPVLLRLLVRRLVGGGTTGGLVFVDNRLIKRRTARPFRVQSPRLYVTITLATLRVAVTITCVFGSTL
jgi:hypothetical protein